MNSEPILRIEGLRTVFRVRGRQIAAVNGLDLTVAAGETVALVGESGSGKSVTSLSVMRLLARKVGSIDKAPETIVALDLDGDGDDDLATAADDLRLWINVGSAEFREAGESPYLLQSPVIALSSGSLDERIP